LKMHFILPKKKVNGKAEKPHPKTT
jgi:putative sensor histidine kinase cpxA